MLGIDLPSWNAEEWAQVASAFFAAVAAFAAWATVFRASRDRRRASWPDLHVEFLGDLVREEVRLTVVNYGGPAREVRVFGVAGNFGFGGYTEPSTYWQPGERRTFRVHVPVVDGENQIMVEGRDMAKRYIFVSTVGGASYRWRHWTRKRSAETVWRRLFPGIPAPDETGQGLVRVELIEREVAGRLSRTTS
ncbi:hypothetical protein OJ998_04785 [Solirubrobacter taibaiensis]|nr:hypothetical protein [Solirubrobacter taibaiensis]